MNKGSRTPSVGYVESLRGEVFPSKGHDAPLKSPPSTSENSIRANSREILTHDLLRTPSWDCPKNSETPVTQFRGHRNRPFRLILAFVYHQSTLRVLPVPLFGQSQKGYPRNAQVRSVLMCDHLIRKHPAFEPTNEFVRKNVGKAIEKESS